MTEISDIDKDYSEVWFLFAVELLFFVLSKP